LNYEFVARHSTSAAQIFNLLPEALAAAGGFDVSRVQVSRLVPYDTRERWGYIATIAKLHYPETLVESLQSDLWARNSALYNNERVLVRNLTAVIDNRIDLFGDNEDALSSGGEDNNEDAPTNNDDFDDNSGGQSSSQQATTAGIAIGAVAVSAIYGAAMFIVARRYKRKRQAHTRSSSTVSSDMSEVRYGSNGSPALMGGALMSQEFSSYGGAAGGRQSQGSGRSGMNNSVRTAGISAPMAAENSLGWN
jgi:hypothetical protein